MPKVIISYRRADSGVITGRIRDRLAQHYGDDSVFMDIDNIPFGMDFRKNIAEALSKNEILGAVIGPDWLGTMPEGRKRIDDETDPVRIEVETALQQGMPTIPVLVGGATMPKPEDLPDSLKELSFQNAAEVDSGRDFHAHMERVIRSMDVILKNESTRSFAWKRLARPRVSIPLASVALLIGALAVALLRSDSGPVFIGNVTYIENQYQQFNSAPLAAATRQQIEEAVALAGQQQFERARDAFVKLPVEAQVPAVWNDLGVVYEKLADWKNARVAYEAALVKDPAFAQAKSNLARLERVAAADAPKSAAPPDVPKREPPKADASKAVAAEAAPRPGAAKVDLTPAKSVPARADLNLLAEEQGGRLLAAPNENWRKITSGNENEQVQVRTGNDADVVYAFKDRKPATFRKLTVLIKETNDQNPKEIEILAGNDGANGSFDSIGKCTLTNRLLFETRYQECEFKETTARFVKIKFVSSYHFNAYAQIPQIQLYGRPAP